MVLLASSEARADDFGMVRLGLGVAVPSPSLVPGPGPAALATFAFPFGLRLDLSSELLTRASPSHLPVRVFGAALGGQLRHEFKAIALFGGAGVGTYSLQQVGGWRTPYGMTVGVHGSLGVEVVRPGGWRPFAEVRPIVHLTDYAAPEWRPSIYFPVIAGAQYSF